MEEVDDSLEGKQFVIQNTNLDNITEILQYYNKWISQLVCILLHINIISRLLILNKFRVKNDYQILIIVQSFINVVSCASDIAYCEIQTINVDFVKIGHPWWNFSKLEVLIIATVMSVSANSTQDFLMLFNLHRLILFTRPNKLKLLYCIAIPIMLFSMFMDAFNSIPVIEKGRDFDLFFKYNSLPFASFIILFCYYKLKKHFKMNSQYSEKTKKLQGKLSTSVLLQLLLLMIVSLVTYFIPEAIPHFVSIKDYDQFFAYQNMIPLMIVQWYPFISAITIIWSITGFFRDTKTISPSIVKPYRKSSTSETKKF